MRLERFLQARGYAAHPEARELVDLLDRVGRDDQVAPSTRSGGAGPGSSAAESAAAGGQPGRGAPRGSRERAAPLLWAPGRARSLLATNGSFGLTQSRSDLWASSRRFAVLDAGWYCALAGRRRKARRALGGVPRWSIEWSFVPRFRVGGHLLVAGVATAWTHPRRDDSVMPRLVSCGTPSPGSRTRDQDYAYARPAMTRNKIRHLELLAGAPPQKGRKGVAGGKSKAVFDAERALSRQAEIAYHRLVTDWRASAPAKAGAGATPGRASPRPSKGQAARQTP
jgi:hypothetical protein